MQITDIEIYDHFPDAAQGLHRAHVGVAFADRFVTLFCTIGLPVATSEKDRDAALIDEALRQLRRMPECRSGQISIELPATTLPADALPLAA
ncbi:hypothetical protein [Pseudodonghicola xiamenensis]|uniref:Uncharacterized protein n=1 Tax=Pseudodonghicola xiamenensis TaxID=337702 RepID=A0A8J3H4L2_9RHOB|nr:hypothetical protein [Pseudodonghicola xiamenensis]GHG81884.1 hypothetical protein GCM10010961_05970 [Pseudodonghicola xiamenensis]